MLTLPFSIQDLRTAALVVLYFYIFIILEPKIQRLTFWQRMVVRVTIAVPVAYASIFAIYYLAIFFRWVGIYA